MYDRTKYKDDEDANESNRLGSPRITENKINGRKMKIQKMKKEKDQRI